MFEEILDNIKTEATTVGAQRRFQLKQRAKTIEELQQRAGKIKGSESISNLLTKTDKMGRPYLSDYMEKLNALEDLQTNQYLNPKTNKPFTPKEWLAASATTRGKARDPETFKSKKAEYQKQYMKARKKADPKFAEMQKDIRKKEYFEKATKKTSPLGKGKGVLLLENNRLLQYMNTAYKKQNKNLKGTDKIPEFEEIFEKGKFVGMRDNKAGTNYYHAGYKGELGPKSKLITSHPDYKNLKNLTRLASEFNKSMPNKTIASYFDAYDRVPTTGELANFLTRDKKYISQYSKQAMSTNPLEVHHTLGVEKKPTKGLQLTLRDKNNAAGSVVDQFNNGSLTKQEATQQLKKLNVRYKLPGTKEYIGAKAISPKQSVKTARQRVTNLFNKAIKENPKLAKDIAKRFNLTTASGVPVDAMYQLGKEVVTKDLPAVVKGAGRLSKPLLTTGAKLLPPAFAYMAAADIGTKLQEGYTFPEALEYGLIGTDIIGGIKKQSMLTPQEREAQQVINNAMASGAEELGGMGYIQGPSTLSIQEAEGIMQPGLKRVQQQLEEQRAQRRAEVAKRAEGLGSLEDIYGYGP